MRYYCPECKSELNVDDDLNIVRLICPVCFDPEDIEQADAIYMQPIPEWETPDQYKERTGRGWKGAVWVKEKYNPNDIWTAVEGKEWQDHYVLCANQDTPPPDDWGKE